MKADYEDQATACEKEVKNATETIKILQDNANAQLKMLKDISNKKELRRVAKGKIAELSKEIGKKQGALAIAKQIEGSFVKWEHQVETFLQGVLI